MNPVVFCSIGILLMQHEAGFELFTDLVFADFLVSYTPYVSHVVFQWVTILRYSRVCFTFILI